MKYALILNNVVMQTQPFPQDGFVEVDDSVICGMEQSGNAFVVPQKSPAQIAEENIAAIKAKAGQIIISRLPEYKQRNYLARKAELQDILIAGGTLSASEQAEVDFLAAEWAWAKAVRAASNEAEAAGTPVDAVVWPS